MVLTLFLLAALIGLDQLTKYLATAALAPDKDAPFLPGILEFRYLLNDGAAFGALSGRAWGQAFLLFFTSAGLVALLVILLLRRRRMDRLCYLSLLLIVAGGAGNLIDRLRSRCVVDFIATLFIDFPVFNLADCFITVGVALLFFWYLRGELRAARAKKAEDVQAAEETACPPAAAGASPAGGEGESAPKPGRTADSPGAADSRDGAGDAPPKP